MRRYSGTLVSFLLLGVVLSTINSEAKEQPSFRGSSRNAERNLSAGPHRMMMMNMPAGRKGNGGMMMNGMMMNMPAGRAQGSKDMMDGMKKDEEKEDEEEDKASIDEEDEKKPSTEEKEEKEDDEAAFLAAEDAQTEEGVIFSSFVPSDAPSMIPSDAPSMIPSDKPSMIPSDAPSMIPSDQPSLIPSDQPSMIPSDLPSLAPTTSPTASPTSLPTVAPTKLPTSQPTNQPTEAPVIPQQDPSISVPSPVDSSQCIYCISRGLCLDETTALEWISPGDTITCLQLQQLALGLTTNACELNRQLIETACCVACPPTVTVAPTPQPTAAPVVTSTMPPNDRPSDQIGVAVGPDRDRPTAAPTPPPTVLVVTETPTKMPVVTKTPTKIPVVPTTPAPTKAPTDAPTKVPTAAPTKVPTPQPTNPPVAVASNPTTCDFCQGLGRGCFRYDFVVNFDNGSSATCNDVQSVSKELPFGSCLGDIAELESMCCPCKSTAGSNVSPPVAPPTNLPVVSPTNPPINPPSDAPQDNVVNPDRSGESAAANDEPATNTVAGGGEREIPQMYNPNFQPGDSIVVEDQSGRPGN